MKKIHKEHLQKKLPSITELFNQVLFDQGLKHLEVETVKFRLTSCTAHPPCRDTKHSEWVYNNITGEFECKCLD